MTLGRFDILYFLESLKQAYEILPLESKKYVGGIEASGKSIGLLEPGSELNDFGGTIISAKNMEEFSSTFSIILIISVLAAISISRIGS